MCFLLVDRCPNSCSFNRNHLDLFMSLLQLEPCLHGITNERLCPGLIMNIFTAMQYHNIRNEIQTCDIHPSQLWLWWLHACCQCVVLFKGGMESFAPPSNK